MTEERKPTAFVDRNGQTWPLVLDVGLIEQVKAQAGVNLGAAMRSTGELSELLFGDPAAYVGMLWVLCEERAQKLGITPEQFGRLFDGPTLERSMDAFLMAVADFFPRSRVGAAIRENLPKMLRMMEDQTITQMNLKMSSLSAGISPATSASTPAS